MRFLPSNKSRADLFNFLKEKHEAKNLLELSKKIKRSYKTVNHWRYDYKKYLPSELRENSPLKLEIKDNLPNNWGQTKGGRIGGKKNAEQLKKLWINPKHREKIRKRGRENIKIIQNKYGEKLREMAIMGKIKKREKESSKLEKANNLYFINNSIKLDCSKIKLGKYDKIKQIKFPTEMSPELAEEIGIHLGDGCLSFNKKYFSVKTNKKEEQYMLNFIFPLYKKLFNLDLKLMKLESVVGFEICSNALFNFKNQVLDIPFGEKVERIIVPKVILDTKNKEIYRSFIRGLFDTDGCVYLVKSKNNYSKISFTLKSEKLIGEVKDMLNKLGFIPYCGKYVIDLNGPTMLKKWIKEINSNNPKNLAKLQQASSSARIE